MSAPGPVNALIKQAARLKARATFKGSAPYWERRYAEGGTSGSGSYGAIAQWKADVVNRWVTEHAVTSVIDLGCGDGNQLGLANYPRYLGIDVSPTAIKRCLAQFGSDATKSFAAYDPSAWHDPAGWFRADLALSMEVIFHLVEDEVFDAYLRQLFASAERYVVICAYDADRPAAAHERYKQFTPWIARHAQDWTLAEHVPHPDGLAILSDLYLYRRTS